MATKKIDTRTTRERLADAGSIDRLKENARELYEARSDIEFKVIPLEVFALIRLGNMVSELTSLIDDIHSSNDAHQEYIGSVIADGFREIAKAITEK